MMVALFAVMIVAASFSFDYAISPYLFRRFRFHGLFSD